MTHASERMNHGPWGDRLDSARFLLRRSLAKLSYAPVPVRLRVSGQRIIEFWWSYVVPFFDPARGFFDYWGHDVPELQFLWRTLKPGMNFFDVGAYHGIYTLLAAKRLERSGEVVSFEPSPREFSRLRLHLRWNGMKEVRAECSAVGAARGMQTFFQVAEGDTTRNGLRPPASNDSLKKVQVNTILLDDYVSERSLSHVDVVKMDVEGGEVEALRGAKSLLARLRPIFICEVLDSATRAWGYEAREIVSTFGKFEYACLDFREGGRLSPHQLKDSYPEVRNYLFVPQEKVSRLIDEANQ